MATLDHVVTHLFPRSLVDGTPWSQQWDIKERADFLFIARVLYPIAAIVYIAHFYLYDKVMGLEPESLWMQFRFSMAGIAILCAIFYASPLAYTNAYRLPAIVSGWIFSYYQAKVIIWYPDAPWLYAYAFTLVAVLVLKTSALKSALFAAAIFATQIPSLRSAGVPDPSIYSACVVTLIFIVILRTGYLTDIRYFLLNQQHLANQKKVIELNIEFTDRIKAFIPSIIAERLVTYMDSGAQTVLQAIDEVLRPRKRQIACIFSDIRGFTQGSKNLDSFVNEGVLPDVKACSHAIEHHGGIPRKVGDLIFAYFDESNLYSNVINAMISAVSIGIENRKMNAISTSSPIHRYILVSTGEAIVGNLGGFDSSIEITALGNPVNYLSRLDELTKHPKLKLLLKPSDILVSRDSVIILKELGIELAFEEINLSNLGLRIRDFPETNMVYRVKSTQENYDILIQPYEYIKTKLEEEETSRDHVA